MSTARIEGNGEEGKERTSPAATSVTNGRTSCPGKCHCNDVDKST